MGPLVRCMKVINSCETQEQLEVAREYCRVMARRAFKPRTTRFYEQAKFNIFADDIEAVYFKRMREIDASGFGIGLPRYV